jgi:cobyrinic acid a,c-diamide synthase
MDGNMKIGCPTIVIGATNSGAGKTSLAIGLCAAFRKRGYRVQPFKVGPDFLDPGYLSRAAGQACYNLDGWMTSKSYVCSLAKRLCSNADIAIVEGVMGLYDGAAYDSLDGCTAEIAQWLDVPVLLAVDAHGCARSFAAMAHGFFSFTDAPRFLGIIANKTGSAQHAEGLRKSLQASELPDLIGAVPKGAFPLLSSRHLGLVSVASSALTEEMIGHFADAAESAIDIDRIVDKLQVSHNAPLTSCPPLRSYGEGSGVRQSGCPVVRSKKLRIGYALDEAFHFYYPDNLELLQEAGAELLPFSPINDAAVPEGLDALIFGGGYPEENGEKLSGNEKMRKSIREFVAFGKYIYAECGGLMYLSEKITDRDGKEWPMVGVLPFSTRMLPKLKRLGYKEVTLLDDTCLGKKGDTLRGHEFHYSEICGDPECDKVYNVLSRSGKQNIEGYVSGSVLASYIHLHLGSLPGAASHFVNTMRKSKDILNE